MKQLLSPSTWSTACAVADPGAENMGVEYEEGVPFPSPEFFDLVYKCICWCILRLVSSISLITIVGQLTTVFWMPAQG